jgi:hypothetical protein
VSRIPLFIAGLVIQPAEVSFRQAECLGKQNFVYFILIFLKFHILFRFAHHICSVKHLNKYIMKRITFLLAGLIIVSAAAFADDDKPITVAQLPASARQFVEKYFPGAKVAFA